MTSGSEEPVTMLLKQVRSGDTVAADRLISIVYRELHSLARNYLRREKPGHTLQPTALVNEAYLRLVGDQGRDWDSRTHFIGVAASVMRRLLIDHARRKRAEKRQGPSEDQADLQIDNDQAEQLLLLNVALERLEALNPRQAQVVELRYFGGLSVEEAAEVLNVSPVTVKRDWALARAWLKHQVQLSSSAITEPPD
jgi:RNA polymerase sigma-70 factor (ECF subfamily)